jgi:hypothetical protein
VLGFQRLQVVTEGLLGHSASLPWAASSPGQRGQPDSSISTEDKAAHKRIPDDGVGLRKPDKRLVPAPHPWSPIGVAPCGPVGSGPIRAMTIISVPLKRLGPLWQSAAWVLDRSGTGPADAAGQPRELDGGSGRCDSGEIGITAVASRL